MVGHIPGTAHSVGEWCHALRVRLKWPSIERGKGLYTSGIQLAVLRKD